MIMETIDLNAVRDRITNPAEYMCYEPSTLRVLAIDATRPLAGVCRLWGDLGDITFRCETLGRNGEGAERLSRLTLWLRDVLAAEPPALTLLLGYGDLGVDAIGGTAELNGVLRLVLFEAGDKAIVVPPADLRLWACGDSGALSGDVAFAAIRRFGSLVDTPEQAASAWLAEIGYHLQAGLDGSTEARRRVLHSLKCVQDHCQPQELPYARK